MRPNTQAHQLVQSPKFKQAKDALLAIIAEGSQHVNGIRGVSSPEAAAQFKDALLAYAKDKGREPYFQFLSSGLGSGPYVELEDGSVKLDLITGIGINFFGHSSPLLMSELVDGLSSDVMQGNLLPGFEATEITRTVLANVGPDSRLKHGTLFCSGTMAGETALKIIRQKKFPATRIFAFQDAFAGRSTAMQEITDNPSYRQQQPTYGEVNHLPFYDPKLGADESAKLAIAQMKSEMTRYAGTYAGLTIELIQGEGGFRVAPREWYEKIFEHAKAAGLAIWFDEVQTFGRTTELFAFRTLDLAKYADVVTIGKLSYACMALYTEEFNPKAGLVAGTFTGGAATLRSGRRIVETLVNEGYYGANGKIAKLSRHFVSRLDALKQGSCKGLIGEIRAIGGMIGFEALDATMDSTKKFLMRLFDEGVIAFYAGHDPYIVRMLPPLGVMTEAQIDEACLVIERTLLALGKKP